MQLWPLGGSGRVQTRGVVDTGVWEDNVLVLWWLVRSRGVDHGMLRSSASGCRCNCPAHSRVVLVPFQGKYINRCCCAVLTTGGRSRISSLQHVLADNNARQIKVLILSSIQLQSEDPLNPSKFLRKPEVYAVDKYQRIQLLQPRFNCTM